MANRKKSSTDNTASRTAEGNELARQKGLTPSASARRQAIADRASQMPKTCVATYLKATRGKASARVAIKAFCMECVGWNRAEVARCTAVACPLWLYRPFRGEGSSHD